jgi:hypothetical protein
MRAENSQKFGTRELRPDAAHMRGENPTRFKLRKLRPDAAHMCGKIPKNLMERTAPGIGVYEEGKWKRERRTAPI